METEFKLPREKKRMLKRCLKEGKVDIDHVKYLFGDMIQVEQPQIESFQFAEIIDYREPFEIINPHDNQPIVIPNAEEILREVSMLILSSDDYVGVQIDEDFKNNIFNAQHHFADGCSRESSGKWRFTMGVHSTIRLTKLHALLKEASKSEASAYIKKLANRIYKKELRISKELGEVLDISEFLNRVTKKYTSSSFEMDEMYYISRWVVISYIRIIEGYTKFAIEPSAHDILWPPVLEFNKQVQEGHIYYKPLLKFELDRAKKKEVTAEIDSIFKETFGFSFNRKEYQGTIFLKGLILNLVNHGIDPYQTIENKVDLDHLGKQGKNLVSYHTMQQIEDISTYLGQELLIRMKQFVITKDEIINLYVFYEETKKINCFANISFSDYFIIFLYFSSYTKDNEILYNLLFEGLKDTSLLTRLESMEKLAKNRKKELDAHIQQERETCNRALRDMQEKLRLMEVELAKVKEHCQELEEQIEDTAALKREVLIHRENLYEQFQESQSDLSISEDQPFDRDYVSLLQEMDLKMVIIGGFPKFVQKWREAFPKIKVVGERDYQLTLNFLNKMDVVIFDAAYNNHSNFERVMSALTSDKPIFKMVRRRRSVDLLCKEIYIKYQERNKH